MDCYEEVYGDDDKKFSGKPHGWIQWKGTEVCMDITCSCGEQSHIDADFAYHFECKCGKKWAIGCNVSLFQLTDDQAKSRGYDEGLCWTRAEE